MSEVTSSHWTRLREQVSGPGLVVDAVSPDSEACLIGVDDNGALHVLISIDEEPGSLPQELEAVVVQAIEVFAGEGFYLDVSARGHYEMIFTPMANQILFGVLIQRRNPLDVVFETIEEFRSALRPLRPTLTLSEQIGLCGELWTLRNVLIPAIGSRACSLWSGPNSERHDFIGKGAHIEVKTTTRSEDRHEISRIDQLRAPNGKKLLFASIQLERTDAGDMTVASLIDDVISALGSDGGAIDAFESRLEKMRWHDELRQSSELKKFNLRNALFFDVEGSFPRLPDDYIPPRGIVAIKYTVDISSRSVLDRRVVDEAVMTML